MTVNIHILRDEADYQAALTAYEHYFDDEPEAGSEAADHFMLLGLLLARYEDEHQPLPETDPIEALHFAMDRLGLAQSDLAKLLGSRSLGNPQPPPGTHPAANPYPLPGMAHPSQRPDKPLSAGTRNRLIRSLCIKPNHLISRLCSLLRAICC